jgi:RNA polymerase sigma-70 factor (ECF subfamily)
VVEGGPEGEGRSDGEVYEAHAAMLVRLATLVVGPHDAPDVVSAAVVRALAAPQWPLVRNHGAYLVRSVQNEARRHLRSTARRAAREERTARREPIDDAAVDPTVADAVRTLSGRQQAVVLLTYWDDMKAADVGAQLGISEGAVKRHLARARDRLRKVLDGTP